MELPGNHRPGWSEARAGGVRGEQAAGEGRGGRCSGDNIHSHVRPERRGGCRGEAAGEEAALRGTRGRRLGRGRWVSCQGNTFLLCRPGSRGAAHPTHGRLSPALPIYSRCPDGCQTVGGLSGRDPETPQQSLLSRLRGLPSAGALDRWGGCI